MIIFSLQFVLGIIGRYNTGKIGLITFPIFILLCILILLFEKAWRNQYFSIPIIICYLFYFSGGPFYDIFQSIILNRYDHIYTLIIFGLIFFTGAFLLSINLLQKKNWSLWTVLILSSLILVIVIYLMFFYISPETFNEFHIMFKYMSYFSILLYVFFIINMVYLLNNLKARKL